MSGQPEKGPSARPDYVPRLWWRSQPLSAWFAEDPRRMFGWFVGIAVSAVALLLWAATDPRSFSGPFRYIAVVGALGALLDAARYGPRAFRAAQRR
jgi:hypothetical protein